MSELPDGWKLSRLADLATIERGRFSVRPRNDPRYFGGETPFAQTGDIASAGKWLLGASQTLSTAGLEVSRTFPAGTVLMTIAANIGACAISTFEVACPDSVVGIQARSGTDSGWLFYALLSLQANLDSAATQNAQKNINLQTLTPLELALPPLPEQRKIAEILNTWDEAIGTAERLGSTLRARQVALVERLIQGTLLTAKESAQSRRESSLAEVLEPVSRPMKVVPDQQYRLIGVRWYLSGAHIHDVVDGSGLVTTQLNLIKTGDVLYNKMWVSKGAFAIARQEHDGAVGTSEYPTFRVKSGADIGYLEYLFHTRDFLHSAKSLCRGTTGRIRLDPKDFLKIQVRLPPRQEQTRISMILLEAQAEIDLQQRYVDALRLQKKALMQQLLTGKVRVTPDGDVAHAR